MSDTNILNDSESVFQNPLAPVLVELIRELSSTRAVLHEAVTMLGEQERKLDRERASRLHLLKEYRAIVGGHTRGDTRQRLEPTEHPRMDERRQAA